MQYLLTLYSEEGGLEDASPEEMKAVMDAWAQFGKDAVDAGVFVAGEGLEPSATASTVTLSEGEEPAVSDGPFAESKEQLGGFYLLDCKDLDEALSYAKRIPYRNGKVEVRPVMDYEKYGGEPAEAEATAS